MEHPQVTPEQFPGMNTIEWDKFLSQSVYRTDVLDEYMSPARTTFPQSVQAEMAMVNHFQSYMVSAFSMTPHEVFCIWEHYLSMYRRINVQQMLSRVENEMAGRPKTSMPHA